MPEKKTIIQDFLKRQPVNFSESQVAQFQNKYIIAWMEFV